MSELYTWYQTLDEVHISFKKDAEESVTNVKYSIKDKKIELIYNGKIILQGILTKRVNIGSEFWIKNGDVIDFYLFKQKNDWWESLLEGSEKVDVNELAKDCNADFSMLDPEAQEALHKMAYESRVESKNNLSQDNE